jgi:hypothetical protein
LRSGNCDNFPPYRLDQTVLKAYGFKASDDILEKLLALNLELAEKEQQGEAIVGT